MTNTMDLLLDLLTLEVLITSSLSLRKLFLLIKLMHQQCWCSMTDICGNQVFDPLWDKIREIRVLGLSCDGATPNRRLWKLYISKNKLVYKVPNMYANDGRDFYLFSDPPHLLKTTRNRFYNKPLWVSANSFMHC